MLAGRPTFGRSRSVVVSHVVWCVLQLVRCIGVPRVVLKVFNGLGALDLLRSAIRCAVQLHTRVRAAWWDTTPWCDTIPRRGAIRYHAVVRYRPERSTGEAGYSQVLRIMIGRRLELGLGRQLDVGTGRRGLGRTTLPLS